MKYAFHPEARVEYREAIQFYQAARLGVGAEFTLEVESVIQKICSDPERSTPFEKDFRRCLATKFPYALLYTIGKDFILILAVMHCSCRPGYWKTGRV